MKDTKELEIYFLCKCESPEHLMLFRSIDNEVYVTFHLKPLPILKRIKNAIKYIFGYTSKFGDFDELILKNEDYQKMYKIANLLRDNCKKEELEKSF